MFLLTPPRRPLRAPPKTMRTAILTSPRNVQIEERTIHDLLPNQVRVRLEGCGVCTSNVPVWEGREWFEYPRPAGSPGHEGWGRVDAVGDDVDCFALGDRVGVLSQNAFAEHDIVDAAGLVKLPPQLDDLPFPAEPLACAVNVFHRSRIAPTDTVAVVGVGFLGSLLIQLSKSAGARVFAMARRQSALQTAADCGADEILLIDDPPQVLRRVRELTADAGCQCVIEATGYQGPLDLASELVGVRGRLVVAGYHQDGLREVNLQSWNWRGIDVINAHERQEAVYIRGMQDAVELVCAGRLNYRSLLTHVFSFDDLSDALQTASQRPEGFVKAIVRMD
jgi:threonine dehydrogenase-like Zn-dependent dehydrogenase